MKGFAGAFRNKSSIYEFRACFPKENTPENSHKKMGEIHMNFSFWPFLWFGLPRRLLINFYLQCFLFAVMHAFQEHSRQTFFIFWNDFLDYNFRVLKEK